MQDGRTVKSNGFHTLTPEATPPHVTSWPFEAWRIDLVRPIIPPSIRGHRFIFVITDYFSKWAKTTLLIEVKTTNVINFIKHHVIHRFGVPSGSSTIMVPNSHANRSIGFTTSARFRIWLQLFTTLPPTVRQGI